MKSQMRWIAIVLLVTLPWRLGLRRHRRFRPTGGRQRCRHRRHQGGQGLP